MSHHYDHEATYQWPASIQPANPRQRLTGSPDGVPKMIKKSRKPPSIIPRETDIVRSILDGLAACGVLAWRVNTGAVTGNHKGKSRFIRFGPKGQADIQGIWHGGRFLAIEVKRPGGKITPDQADWLARVRNAGGIALVVHSWTEVSQKLWERSL